MGSDLDVSKAKEILNKAEESSRPFKPNRGDSIRGKKAHARARAHLQASGSDVGRAQAKDQSKENSFQALGDQNNHNGRAHTGTSTNFQFSAPGRSEMSHKLRQSSCGDTGSDARGDQGMSNSGHGVVRRQFEKGLEDDLFSNGEECEGRWASSIRPDMERGKELMVDLFGRHTRTGGGGENSVGTVATGITKPDFVHNESMRMFVRTQNAGKGPNFHKCYGEQANKEVDSSVLP